MIPHSSHKSNYLLKHCKTWDSKTQYNLRVIMNLLEVWLPPGGGKCPLANLSPHQPSENKIIRDE